MIVPLRVYPLYRQTVAAFVWPLLCCWQQLRGAQHGCGNVLVCPIKRVWLILSELRVPAVVQACRVRCRRAFSRGPRQVLSTGE